MNAGTCWSAAAIALVLAVSPVGIVDAAGAGPVIDAKPRAAAPERAVVGTLVSIQTFAQSTGWAIAGLREGFEADVSAVLSRAERLNGSRVRATGHFEQRRYEHATVRVFVVTSLRRA